MISYVRPENQNDACQGLQLVHARKVYAFRLEHAASNEEVHGPARNEHAHEVYHLILYRRGRGEFLANGARRPYAPGMLMLTGPGERHCFSPVTREHAFYAEMTFAYIASSGEPLTLSVPDMLALHAGTTLPTRSFPLQLPEDQAARLHSAMERTLARLALGGPFAALRLRVDMGAVFEELAHVLLADDGAPSATPDALQTVRDHIERHYAERLPVAALARMAHLSVGYFLRAYRKSFGMPPIAHQQRLRVEAARTLLRTTALRGKEIARRVGFGDEYCFSKAFRKIAGITPTQYRAQLDPISP